ncbi:MAG: HesB/IscA family protein [Candidatus Binatia bacterium]
METHETHDHGTPAAGTDGPLIELTDLAVERFRQVMKEQNLGPEQGVRIGVASGGCSGMSYSMGFESSPRAEDTVVEQAGVKIFVDPESAKVLTGVTIDYVVGLHREGFKFLNPKAARTCGCGESFGV